MKLTLFKTRIKVKRLALEKGFWTAEATWLFSWFSVNDVLSSIWVVLLHRSVPVLIIIKAGLEKCQKFMPKKCNVYQKQFHCHFNSEGRNEKEDWKITIIDSSENVLELWHRERYWQHRLNSFSSNELNECFVDILMLYFVLLISGDPL